MVQSPILRFFLQATAPLAVAVTVIAAAGTPEALGGPAETSSTEQVFTFTVRGVVKKLPSGQPGPRRELLVKHEEIPEYRDRSGKVVGMMAMTMPFYLAPQLSLEGIQVGDAVELSVEQRIEPRFSDEVVAIRKTP